MIRPPRPVRRFLRQAGSVDLSHAIHAFPSAPVFRPRTDGEGAAELIFSVFKDGDGGLVDMNIQRWIGQFRPTDGIDARVDQRTATIGGNKVTILELEGSHAGMRRRLVPAGLSSVRSSRRPEETSTSDCSGHPSPCSRMQGSSRRWSRR